MFSLKYRILFPLIMCLTLLFGAAIAGLIGLGKRDLSEHISLVAQSASNHYRMSVREQAQKLGVAMSLVQNDERLLSALEAGDRDALLENSQATFTKLLTDYGISHFYFHNSERVNILRVHQPDRFGDTIDRFTMLEAERTGSLAQGLELGSLGTFTLRVVAPVHRAGKLLGYIELGEDVDALMPGFKDMVQVELLTFINKKYLTRSDWQKGMAMLSRSVDWDLFPDKVLVSKTLVKLPEELKRLVAESASEIDPADTMLRIGDRTFSYWFVPLKEARAWALVSIPAWLSAVMDRTMPSAVSAACYGMIRRRASCATRTPGTRAPRIAPANTG